MYQTVEHINTIFAKIQPKYWIVREKDKNGTVKFTSDNFETEDQYANYQEALLLLPHGIYNISMRKDKNATKDAPNYTFQYGDGVQGVGNTAAKSDNMMVGAGNNWGANSMFGMMMMMFQESQKTNQQLLMQLNQTQIQGVQVQHQKEMELFKLQMQMAQNKTTGDKLLGVLVSPNMPKILEAVSGMMNGQPVAVGRLSTEGVVPPLAGRTPEAENETPEGAEQLAFDPNTLTPEQRAVYDKGMRINGLMARIKEKYPDSDPLDTMEAAADAMLNMSEDSMNSLLLQSMLTA